MLEESNLGGIFVTLNDGTLGEPNRILAVDCEGALRRRLLDMGLTPKTIISIRKVAPMGDPLELTVRGYQLTLRKEDAARIKVEPVKGHSPGQDQQQDGPGRHGHRHGKEGRIHGLRVDR